MRVGKICPAGEQRLSPDGRWVLYFIPEGKGTKARLMRMPAAGGEPEPVLLSDGPADIQCSQVGGGPCDILDLDGSALAISLFDPVKGRGPRVLRSSDIREGATISPDEKRIAFRLRTPLNRIRIVD